MTCTRNKSMIKNTLTSPSQCSCSFPPKLMTSTGEKAKCLNALFLKEMPFKIWQSFKNRRKKSYKSTLNKRSTNCQWVHMLRWRCPQWSVLEQNIEISMVAFVALWHEKNRERNDELHLIQENKQIWCYSNSLSLLSTILK